MTARTNFDRGLRERKHRAKKRRRQIFVFAAIGLLCFGLMRLMLPRDTAAIAEQQGEQPVYQPSTTNVSKANPKGENVRPEGRIVYLTFDDGPSEWTEKFFLTFCRSMALRRPFLCKEAISGTRIYKAW